MATINVEDAYILDETGAQVDKVTGLFTKNENATTGEKQMARLNIAAGGSNRNLLDNAYFVGGGSQLGDGVFPINQRGQASYSGAVIGMDRWRNNGNGAVTLAANGVTFQNTNGWTDGLNQRYAGDRFPLGEQVTFTVQMSDLSFHSCTITVPTSADTQTPSVEAGTSGVYFSVRTNNGYYSQSFVMCGAGTSASIRQAKVELGTVSTLANDAPPDFGEELRKCKRYFRYVPFTRSLFALESAWSIAIKTLDGIEMASFPTAALVQAGSIVKTDDPTAWATQTGVSVVANYYNTPTIQIAITPALSGIGYVTETVISLSCEL